MNEGWVKLYRSLLDNEVWRSDPTAWRIFEYLLLSCDKETGVYRSGRYRDSEFLALRPITFYKALKRLENKYKMVVLVTGKVTIKYTDVTIINWHKYQDGNQVSNNPVTIQEQSSNNQVTLNKNKELRNKKKEITPSFLQELIDLVNPREKATKERERSLNARLEDYTQDEIREAAKRFSQSKWHKDNGQLSIDNLLAPSKFGRWHAQEEGAGKRPPRKAIQAL